MIQYELTLNSDQAHETLKAVELLMRLKINQPKEISRAVMPEDYRDEETKKVDSALFDDHIRRRDHADEYMEKAFREIFPDWSKVRKDREWHILYNLYQAIRYAIHEAEHPETTGVDSNPPMQFTDEPIPLCVIKQENGSVSPVRGGYGNRMWECGACHAPVGIVGDDRRDDYCRKCGKKVGWPEKE